MLASDLVNRSAAGRRQGLCAGAPASLAGVRALSRVWQGRGDPQRVRRHAILPVDLETRADVVILPPESGGAAALPCRGISVASAIRYVVEELSRDERPRAVVCTPTGSMFIDEIEALYDQPEFPEAA